MIAALLLLAINSFAYPQWEMLTLYQPYLNGRCDFDTESPDYLPSARQNCDANPDEFGGPQKCREIIDACKAKKCYNQTAFTNIDQFISSLDNSTKSVVLWIESNDQVKIDLTKLPTRMQVYINCFRNQGVMNNLKMVNNFNQALDLLLQKQPLKPSKLNTEETSIFKLVGGIKEKVSFLNIHANSEPIEIVDRDLDVPVLSNMAFSNIIGAYKATVDRLYNFVDLPIPTGLTTNEITLFDASAPDFSIMQDRKNYTITLDKTKWKISFVNEDEEFIQYVYDYPLTKQIGLLAYIDTNVTIHRETDGLLPNLSLNFDIFIPYSGPLGEISVDVFSQEESKLLEKKEIIIYKTGDWSDVAKGAFNLTLGFNSDFYSVNPKQFEEVATITTTEPRNPVNEYVVSGDDETSGGNDGPNTGSDADSGGNNDDPNIGLIVGIVVACVVVVAAIIVVVVIVLRKKKAQVAAS